MCNAEEAPRVHMRWEPLKFQHSPQIAALSGTRLACCNAHAVCACCAGLVAVGATQLGVEVHL